MNETLPKQTCTDFLMQYIQYTKAQKTIERYCMFIGYPRSGHTLVRSILDAHKNALIANECDALAYFTKNKMISKRRLYMKIIHNSQYHAKSGNNWTNFSYDIPHMYQGSYTKLTVIGDKKGGRTTLRLREDSTLIDRLQKTVQVPIVVLHCIRNPYDNIATMAKKSGRDVDTVIQDYKERVTFINAWEKKLPKNVQYVYLYHEALIEHSEKELKRLLKLLNLSRDEAYMKAVKKKIHTSPHGSSREIKWTAQQKTEVDSIIRATHFLNSYAQ